MRVILILIGLFLFSSVAFSADCRVDGGSVFLVRPNIVTDVRVNLTASPLPQDLILNGYNLECRWGAPNNVGTDNWESRSPGFVPSAKLSQYPVGLYINGNRYPAPLSTRVRIISLTHSGTIGVPGPWGRLNVYAYIQLEGVPARPVDIKSGDMIGELKIIQWSSSTPTGNPINIRLIANNDLIISPSSCTINNNQPINIDYGSVDGRSIGESTATTQQKINYRLNYNCPTPGITSPITVTLNGNAASFDNNFLQMSNADLAIGMLKNGAVVPVGTPFNTDIVNSSGGDDVTFALIRRPGSVPATGDGIASGVLIMGIP